MTSAFVVIVVVIVILVTSATAAVVGIVVGFLSVATTTWGQCIFFS